MVVNNDIVVKYKRHSTEVKVDTFSDCIVLYNHNNLFSGLSSYVFTGVSFIIDPKVKIRCESVEDSANLIYTHYAFFVVAGKSEINKPVCCLSFYSKDIEYTPHFIEIK